MVQGPDPRRTAQPWKSGGLPTPSQAGSFLSGVDASGAAIAVPVAEGGAPAPGAVLPQGVDLFLPEERPIPSAQFINENGQNSSTGVESDTFIPGVDFTLPNNTQGRLDGMVFFVQNLQPTSALSFTLWFNNGPVQGFTGLEIFPANLALFVDPYDMELRIPPQTRVRISYSNADGGTYLVGASFSGWFWTIAAGLAWMQQGKVGSQ